MRLSTRLVTIALFLTLAALGAYSTAKAKPRPIPIPPALLEARQVCPDTASLSACRGELRKALQAVAWQRSARFKIAAGTSRDVVLDAIQWASQQTGVPAAQMRTIGECESHLFWLAQTGQFKGWAQLGDMHRSDPIFRVVPWQDPYAQAIHMARFIKAHGEGQWQCTSTGGLRW